MARERATGEGRPVGSRLVGVPGVIAMGSVLGCMAVVAVAAVISFWPPDTATPVADAQRVRFLWATAMVDANQRLFVIVATAGFLGALVHGLRSFIWYVGNRRLKRSWLALYLLGPFVGSSLGVIVYLAVRGGFLSAQGDAADVSPYGLAAFAAIVGLFAEQAVQKLKQVFETLLAPAPEGEDHVAPATAAAPSVASFDPATGPVGTSVRLRGASLDGTTAVEFNGLAAATFTVVSATEVTAVVPAGATTGPITVRGPAGGVASEAAFIVEGAAPAPGG